MSGRSVSLCGRAAIAVACGLLAAITTAESPPTAVDFERQIMPILVRSCIGCHNASQFAGELDLTRLDAAKKGGESAAPAIEPGRPEESYLLERVEAGEMPPKGKGKPLSAADVGLLKNWIAAGAAWPEGRQITPFEFSTETRGGRDWWSLQAPVRPEVPKVAHNQWVRTPIDAFVLAELEKQKLTPSDDADRGTFIRRAKLDLLGLPPSPEEIDAFIKDASPDAYEKLIDGLLASPHYGERWGRHWLDVVRFAESHGYETNTARPNAWPYRDYVIKALNEDRPYPQFILEQLAGDQVGAPTATGFLVGGAHDNVGSPDPELTAQQRLNDLDDMTSTTSTAFLGLTIGCAKCHDHKFDAISQKDYYAMQGMLAGVQHGERDLKTPESQEQREKSEQLRRELARIEGQTQALLAKHEPLATAGQYIWIDDVSAQNPSSDARGISVLAPPAGSTKHALGAARGQVDDPGDAARSANVGQGYTYWRKAQGADVFSYNPATSGKCRVWLSWGCGWDTHAPDAQYILDADGDLATRGDQTVLATIDQRCFADRTPSGMAGQPLWSGFYNAGIQQFSSTSRIVLRGGDSDAVVTADMILLEKVKPEAVAETRKPARPLATARPPVHTLGNVDRFAPVKSRFVRLSVSATNVQSEPCIDELEVYTSDSAPRNVALASAGAKATASTVYQGGALPIHQTKNVNDGLYGNSHSWISAEAGAGWIQIELPEAATIDRVVWARDREGTFRDRLAVRYKIEVATEPDRWQVVASSDDRRPYNSQARTPEFASPEALPAESAAEYRRLQAAAESLRSQLPPSVPQMVYAGNFVQPAPINLLYRGEPLQKRELVPPAVIKSVGESFELPTGTPDPERRKKLAAWIGDASNPLTARVMVNRIWHYHFGQGLVKTPSDFGFNGGRPSHPELLDWLATEFIAQSWRPKAMHRMIMLSSVYRQSSKFNPMSHSVDGTNRLLWRYSPRRLEAEPIRDSMLWVSGALDLRMGGPGYDAFEPNGNYVKVYTPKQKFGPAEWRRMVYQSKPRMQQDGIFGEFDCPDSSQVMARRNVSTTALQALNLLNGNFIVQQAGLMADRLKRDAGAEPDAQIRRAFWLAFGRAPDQQELAAAKSVVKSHGLSVFCRAMLNANEFIYIN